MNSETTFDAPRLQGSQNPTILTKAELYSGDVALMARYPVKEGDDITFSFVTRDTSYTKRARASSKGEADGAVGVKFSDATDWELIGKDVNASFEVSRGSTPLGRSYEFHFQVLNE